MAGGEYSLGIWSPADLAACAGDLTAAGGLPQNWAELKEHYPEGPSWDTYYFYPDNDWTGTPEGPFSRDSDSMDFWFSAPSMLKYVFGLTGPDLDAAEALMTSRRDSKKAAEETKGANAGTGWFLYSKASFQPVNPDGWGA